MKHILATLALIATASTLASCGDGKHYAKVTITTEQFVEVDDLPAERK